MPRKSNFIKPGIRKYGLKSHYTQATLEEAVSKIKDSGMSINACSKQYNIPRSTLKNKIIKKHGLNIGRPTVLSVEEEKIITNHILALSDCGIPIGLDDVKFVIQSYLNANNRLVKVFKNNLPGWEWGQLFLNRHPELKNKFAHNISRSRAQVNEGQIIEFFDKLDVEMKDVPPENIFNFDETGFHDNPKKKKVLFRRTCRNPDIIRNSTKSCYTVVFCGNAAGEFVPPFFVFKAKHTWSDWLTGAPKGSRMAVTKNGWIDGECFDEWFKSQFLPFANKKTGIKVLLCDNLSSHITINTLRACKENNVKLICLPPNSTHLLQPLDVGYFASLKSNWRAVLLSWRQTQRGIKSISLPKNCFSQLVTKALKRGEEQAAENLRTGFRATGLFPIDRQTVLQKLPVYAKTTPPDPTDSLGDSFKNYLQEIRTADLGIANRRKIQLPVTAGKSISVEEVEEYYKKKEEKTNPAKKRGRPQGSQNKKKLKTKKQEVNQSESNVEIVDKQNFPLEKNDCEEEGTSDDGGLSTLAKKKKEKNQVNTSEIQIENSLEDILGEKTVEEGNVPADDIVTEIVEDYVVLDGQLIQFEGPAKETLSVGTMCTFRCEGSLFPGKVLTFSHPWYTLVTMSKSFDGGWIWPDKREITKCKKEDIVSVIETKNIVVKSFGKYLIYDDLLYMEWGE